MEILLLILLLAGPCSSDDSEALFCEGAACDAMAVDAGSGGAGGTGEGGAAGSNSSGEEGGGGAGQHGAGGVVGASTTGGDPPPCECDDGNPCNGLETCAGDGSCVTTGEPRPVDDRNACTDDYCADGAPVHQEQPIDDGNPCTSDYCNPDLGVIHSPIAACMD